MPHSPSNLFLDSLNAPDRELLLSRSIAMSFPQKSILYEPQERSRYAYFLTSGVLSSITITAEGETAEVAVTGREGVVNALLLLGPECPNTQGVVQVDAAGYRIPLVDLQRIFLTSERIRGGLLQFVQAEAVVMETIAGCHRFHDTEQRMARWLLSVHDRVTSDDLHLTQTFLAAMLGTRRPTVTLVMQGLERRGLLEGSRGQIRILDRAGLEAVACECYRITRQVMLGLYRTPL